MKGIFSPVFGACICACAFAAHAAVPEPSLNIDAFDVDGNTLLDQETIENAVYPFMGPGRHRQDVAAAVDALQKAYRDKGFSTVVVQVPQQDARGGIVKLHILEEPVGRLRVVGSSYTLPSRIKEQMPSLAEGKVPNFTKAQEELAEVNRFPQTQVTPVEHQGKTPGTVDVDLKVKDSLPLHASASVSNDHSQNTTQLRTTANVSYSNLFQLGHTISGSAILAPENTKDSMVLSGSYSAPIWGSPWTVLMSGYTSNSNVQAVGGTGVLGRGFTISVAGQLDLPPLGDFAENMTFGVDFKHSVQYVVAGGAVSLAGIDYWPLSLSYKLFRDTNAANMDMTGTITLGLRGLGAGVTQFFNNRAFARPNFTKFNLEANYLRRLPWDLQLAARLTAQLADQPLLPNEEFSAGGLSSLRGYLQSEALGDEGFSADFTLNSPSLAPLAKSVLGDGIIDDWRFFIFSDSAVAWVLDRLPEQRSVFSLSSIGIGTRMDLLSHLSGNVLMGMPLRNGVATKAWHPTLEFSASTEF
ncbi:MAG TPA: ShlB/FhaC/HecB family hemolysin secretion/activation protein [Rhizomicrobium sp.]|nr:ShlB/FhaC/HecB family hemolysin secretion/activation protein [Rhizomicrobium sp.]